MEMPTEGATPPDDYTKNIEIAVRFLSAIFDDHDHVLLRPIESWNEAGRQISRVDYANVRYPRLGMPVVQPSLQFLLRRSAKFHLNIYFSACPRLGSGQKYDLAWQIRTVRTLWADIDHVSPREALTAISDAKLPEPSIVVNSGNGVHVYWLLEEPVLIDDVGSPSPVLIDWVKKEDGSSKPRKYVVQDKERVYLDQNRQAFKLSPKALHVQHTLAGIAESIGGDHTKDLSRLLRLPGTMNRKDERNGREPILTELLVCEPERRYPFQSFETFAAASSEARRAAKIASMPLPRPRKLTATKADKFDQLIAASSIAEPGCRSEADFAVCCYAVQYGIEKEEAWQQVQGVGKFAEQGRRYFDITWENAEEQVRTSIYQKVEEKNATSQRQADTSHETEHSSDETHSSGHARPTIVVDTAQMPVGDTLHKVTDRLLAAGNCFSRAEQFVVIHDQEVCPILASPELAGLLNQFVEFYFVDDEEGEYKPFPPNYANTWLNHHVERGRLPRINLFTSNPVFTEDWRLVQPGYDAQSGIYYAGPSVAARSGTEHLDKLLKDFCFKSPGDRTNFIGVLLTAILMPRFIGSKPAALFNGNQPELGKSILAQTIAILRDGRTAETASYNPNDEEFEKRLGAIVRRGVTTVIIDNAKARGRNPRIDSACLERSITDHWLTFRLLGQSASIRAENSHIFCITANASDVSRDLMTRSVVINLYYEGDPERRKFTISDPEGYALEHRTEILGELIGMVQRWLEAGKPEANVNSRFNKRGWGQIVGGILECCGEPDFMSNADEAAAQLDETRREFSELVDILADHPQGNWTASELVELCGKHSLLTSDLGEGSPRSLSTKMGTLAGRFIDEGFPFRDQQIATFHRSDSRKGKVYSVSLSDKVPNLDPFAEPLPNLQNDPGAAP